MYIFDEDGDLSSRLPEQASSPDPLERISLPARRQKVRKRRLSAGARLLLFASVPLATIFIPIISLESYGVDTNIGGMIESLLEPTDASPPKPVGIPSWDENVPRQDAAGHLDERLERHRRATLGVEGGGTAITETKKSELPAPEELSSVDDLRERFRNPYTGVNSRANFDRFLRSLNEEFAPSPTLIDSTSPTTETAMPGIPNLSPVLNEPDDGSRVNFDRFLETLGDREERMDRDRLRTLYQDTAPRSGSRSNFDQFLESLRDE